jgi:hypothetical protein
VISLLWTDPGDAPKRAASLWESDPTGPSEVGWCADQRCVVVSFHDHATCVAAAGAPVLADLDRDGRTDVVLPTDHALVALSTRGVAPATARHARGDAANSGFVR